MFNWLSENSGALNVILNACTLLVWLLYFHVLFLTFRRQNRPNILINRGAGEDAEARCLISNMSSSPIYVQAVRVDAEANGKTFQRTISDTEKFGKKASSDGNTLREFTSQGPLKDGDFLDLGTFEEIADKALSVYDSDDGAPESLRDVDRLGITIIAVYTAKHDVIGATRKFKINVTEDAIKMEPETILAHQYSKPWERRSLMKVMNQETSRAKRRLEVEASRHVSTQ